MVFGVYWIAVSLELLYTTGCTARVTRPHSVNATAACSSGNQSLAKCGVHAATRFKMKYHRRQMYSTQVGFTYPKVPNSYEIDMGYSPNVGFEPYWPGTRAEGTTRRDYIVCGVICPGMYLSYGPVCAVNKNQEYANFISYCDMRNADCVGAWGWRAVYKGECFSSIRTYPTKSSDIRNRIKMYITDYYRRTPTTREKGTDGPGGGGRKFAPHDTASGSDGDATGSRDGSRNHNGIRNGGARNIPPGSQDQDGILDSRAKSEPLERDRNSPARKDRREGVSRKGGPKVQAQNVVRQSDQVRKSHRRNPSRKRPQNGL